ncbi:MAG: hypothetical protein ACRDGH_00625 [Candidatus Limnocylindria bacterium]
MRRLIVSEFVTLDGVMEAPGFEEHRDGKNAWALRFQNAELQRFIRDQFSTIDAFLLGRDDLSDLGGILAHGRW